jgi:hypothetical protein
MERDAQFFQNPMLEQLQLRPCHGVLLEGPFDVANLVQDFYPHLIRSETSINRYGVPSIDMVLFQFDDGVIVFVSPPNLRMYAPTLQAAESRANEFRRYLKSTEPSKPIFYVISISGDGATAQRVTVDRAVSAETRDLALNYGDDFPGWEEQWMKKMQGGSTGLSILYGPPGCGKTSYLRALMARMCATANFYYIPVANAEMISNPAFVGFWARQSNRFPGRQKVVILEDAEELLLTRAGGTRNRVSSLLNIADGCLGDCLEMQVIATTNVEFTRLDPAIIRPGRLLGAREFRRLNRQEALRLVEAKGLTMPKVSNQSDFSLAELYCPSNELAFSGPNQRIGFG